MKPLKLFLKNIGPYRNEIIDFTKLDNMFLIKGDTGAGKTFIFDAVTFALYGDLRGSRKGHESNLKSRYAEETEESFVEFEFELFGKKYKIYRTIPFNYTNRNGKKSKKISEVSLQEFKNNDYINIEGKLSEINEKICEIIGLSADEFAQIVLLPQGEFAKFLKQNTSERAETLKKLFPVDFYSDIVENIQKKTKSAEEQLKICDTLIATISKDKDFSNANEKILKMENEIEIFEKLENELRSEQTEITKKIENLKNAMDSAKEYENNENELKKLEEKSDEFKKLEKKILDADKAKSLKEFIIKAEENQKNLEKTKNELETENKNFRENKKIFDLLKNQKKQMELLQKQNEKDGQILATLQEKLKNAAELENFKNENQIAKKNKLEFEKQKSEILEKMQEISTKFDGKTSVQILNEISAQIQNFTEKKNELSTEISECNNRDKANAEKQNAQKKLTEANENLKKEEEKLLRTKKTLEELEKNQKENEEKNQAYTVSLFLKKGFACPVCGSVEHPFPAEKPKGLLDFTEQIKTHKNNIESIQKLTEKYKTEAIYLNNSIQNFEDSLKNIKTTRNLQTVKTELASIIEEIEQKEDEKKEINDLNAKLENLNKNLVKIEENLNNANQNYAESKAKLESLEKTLGESLKEIQKKEAEISLNLKNNKQKYEKWNQNYNESRVNSAKITSKIEKLNENFKNYSEQFEIAEKNLEIQIKKSDFSSLQQVKDAFLNDEELYKFRQNLSEYNENLRSLKDAVKRGKDKNPKKYKDLCCEFEQIKKKSAEIEEKYVQNHKISAKKQNEARDFKNEFQKIQSAQNEKLELEKKLRPLKALNDNVSGKNPQKLQLESWALGMYFEQVAEFASQRFFDISDGRFSFQLKKSEDFFNSGNGYKGLDLLVFDSHTGKTSDPAELSGGETFEASISLALAVTDVVQNNNGGGIQLDSLFIDEGFGTLDPETLEKAMTVLTELGETKMIGIISHVSEMENFMGINSAINVQKSKTGSHIVIE